MAETLTYKRKSRIYGFLCTSFVAGVILLILLLIILRTPIPPYPEGGGGTGNGIELNLGYSDAGMGNNPQELNTTTEENTPQPEKTSSEKENLMTQEVEDAPSVSENTDKKVKKPVKTPVEEKPTITRKETVKPKQPTVNVNALYPSHSGHQASSDGDNHTAGDKGNPNGTLAAQAFGNGGSGGSGGGSGGGIGTGVGKGTGSGAKADLKDRTPMSLPLPKYKDQVEGVVVVAVTVDKEGNVTQAEPGQKGTTTTDSNLWDAAKKAAQQARFDRKPDAPAFQKGTITYRFRLQ